MMQTGFKIFAWDETTGKADFYRQGILILTLTLPSYEEAQRIYKALEDTYERGVQDGLTWVAESINDKRNRI